MYNRGEYLEHALNDVLRGKVWPDRLRHLLQDIQATSKLYPIDKPCPTDLREAISDLIRTAQKTTRDRYIVTGAFLEQLADLLGK